MENQPNRRLVVLAALFLVFSLLVFAGATASAAEARPSSSPETTRGVLIVLFAFRPSTVTVSVGDTVTWINAAFIPHTTTSDTGLWASGRLNRLGRFSFTFTKAGTYTYHCSIHPFMKGSIVVQ